MMGYTDRERRRLCLQATVVNPLTERLLNEAGLQPGIRVLDLGCGIGDVSLIAGKLVGPRGQVRGWDVDRASLEVARLRAYDQKQHQVTFEEVDFAREPIGQVYDAVVGRHVLIHMADPEAMIRKAASILEPGGVLVFQEYDFTSWPSAYPELPLITRMQGLLTELFRRGTSQANMGMRLFHLMTEAGLQQPNCRAECLIDGGPDSTCYEWLAETVRSVVPKLEALGLATETDLQPDTLAERMRQEALSRRGCLATPPIVSAFAYKA
jgi:ubiquinone/menaquinone biosynthesis C-methylase UbiE